MATGEMQAAIELLSGEELGTLSSAQVRVRFKSKDYVLPLLVMKRTVCNLLGRDWFSTLNIRVHGVNQVTEPSKEIQDVLARHPDVFKEGIDRYVGPLDHLDMKEGAEAYSTEDSPRNDLTNGPAAGDQQDAVPAPYVISLPPEAPPPHDLPTTPDPEHREAEARLDTCATQARDDERSGSAQHQTAPRPQRDRRPTDRYRDPI
ncbi:hypothetical protein MRX96_025694 [Rhipicephalus microplus]